MSDNWFYAEGRERKGPVARDEVVALLVSGRLGADSLVWTDGMADWEPARNHFKIAADMPGDGSGPPAFDAPAPGPDYPVETSFVPSFVQGVTRYVDFAGRSNRPEFWWYQLAVFLLGLLTSAIDGAVLGMPVTNTIVSLGLFIPGIAVGVRRLHDISRSGWWYLLVLVPIIGWIVLLVWFCQPGHDDNRWGASRRGQ